MLLEFTLNNFMSFCNTAYFSMDSGEDLKGFEKTNLLKQNDYHLLKSAILFGENGSGKSNLFLALKIFKDLILNPTVDANDKLPYFPFAMSKSFANRPTSFDISFVKNGRLYDYYLQYDAKGIIREELLVTDNTGDTTTSFRRDKTQKDDFFSESLIDARKQLRENRLLLVEGKDKGNHFCKEVIDWFNSNLVFWNPDDTSLFNLLKTNEPYKNKVISLLNAFDIGISDITIDETEINLVYKRYDNEGNVTGTVKLPYDKASSGTKNAMSLILLLLHSQQQDKILVMDGFDASLHPSLSKAILTLINSKENTSQCLLSSHNVNLMDDCLRIDQIYIAEKNFNGETTLHSIFDFTDKKDLATSKMLSTNISTNYFNGLFGGLPDIDFKDIEQFRFVN